jgi:hypothetical protein
MNPIRQQIGRFKRPRAHTFCADSSSAMWQLKRCTVRQVSTCTLMKS